MQITMSSKHLWCTQSSWQFQGAIKSHDVNDMALNDYVLNARTLVAKNSKVSEVLLVNKK